jgi:chitinase
MHFGFTNFHIFYRNYNYGASSPSVVSDSLCNPDKVAEDPVLGFKTAIWFWKTPQYPKPSCHDVMVGRRSPNAGDVGRKPGFGQTINIINGFYECGPSWGTEGQNRIKYYKDFCRALNVSPGEYLECKDTTPYGVNLQIKDITAIQGSFDFPCCKKGCSASHRAESWQQI